MMHRADGARQGAIDRVARGTGARIGEMVAKPLQTGPPSGKGG